MSEPLRTDAVHRAKASGDRDATIEGLLLGGLDHYFASDYEQAIDVWSRVLFIDRGHARARAYIERARSALAEQQRASEELVHSGIAAFERGELDAARRLLSAAVARGGAHDVALAFLARVDRVAPVRSEEDAGGLGLRRSSPALPPAATPPSRRRLVTMALVLGAVGGALFLATGGPTRFLLDPARFLLPSLREVPSIQPAPVNPPETAVIVPRSSEAALDRARALFASGRLHDALRTLELVRPADPLRADANRLKAEIQRDLLAHSDVPPAPTPPAPPVSGADSVVAP